MPRVPSETWMWVKKKRSKCISLWPVCVLGKRKTGDEELRKGRTQMECEDNKNYLHLNLSGNCTGFLNFATEMALKNFACSAVPYVQHCDVPYVLYFTCTHQFTRMYSCRSETVTAYRGGRHVLRSSLQRRTLPTAPFKIRKIWIFSMSIERNCDAIFLLHVSNVHWQNNSSSICGRRDQICRGIAREYFYNRQ